MDLLDPVRQFVDFLFNSTVNVQLGFLFLLFFAGLLLGWLFGH